MAVVDLTLAEQVLDEVGDNLTVVGGSIETVLLHGKRLGDRQRQLLIATASRHAEELCSILKALERA